MKDYGEHVENLEFAEGLIWCIIFQMKEAYVYDVHLGYTVHGCNHKNDYVWLYAFALCFEVKI
jgi:hypothetical protein